MPDVAKLLPADLILYSSPRGDKIGAAISAVQLAGGFAAEDARWTHAAVYLGDGHLVEAIPNGGVIHRSVYDDPQITSQLMRFRRKPDLSETDRYRVALKASAMLGASYSRAGAVSFGMTMLKGLWQPTSRIDLKGIVICSQVFHDTLAEITRQYLPDCPVRQPVAPAHLSFSPGLEDVEVSWLRLI